MYFGILLDEHCYAELLSCHQYEKNATENFSLLLDVNEIVIECMSVFIKSDRPGACSGRDTVLRFSELLQRQCFQIEKVLLIYLFIYLMSDICQ